MTKRYMAGFKMNRESTFCRAYNLISVSSEKISHKESRGEKL